MGQAVNLYMTQQGVRLVIPATQGENLAREYDITVIGLDGQPVDLTGTTVSMYVIKRGGETVQIAATVSGNVATVVLPSGACDTPGDNVCFIQVIKPDVYDLRVDNVILRVIPCDLDSAGTASEEFGTLTQLIADAQTAISNANTAAENANEAAEEATSTAETTATSVATTVATNTATNVINQQKGLANGLASLDADGKLAQMPTAADVGAIPTTEKGAASGVATLDENATLTPSQIPDTVVTSDETAAGAADARTGPLQMGKVLWTGTWNTGTLEVPGISKYTLLGFRIYDNYAMLFAANYSGNLRGIGGSSWASGTASHYFINCTLDGDTLTMVAANGQTISGSGDGNAIASIRPITGIVGLL